jgi:hypothetical protein
MRKHFHPCLFLTGRTKSDTLQCLPARFYRSDTGREPVREWLKSLDAADRRCMVLLHGFMKKTQKTPKQDIDLALKRKKGVET